MNSQEIIENIIARLPARIVGDKTDPANWVRSNSRVVTYRGVNYIQESYQCMENYGLEPAGLIATVVLNENKDQILDCVIEDLSQEVEGYSRMVEQFYGHGIDNLRKN